jgi:hypothetical protein
MLIASEALLLMVQQALVEATHGITDTNGQRVVLGTIDDRRLEMAALTALQIAAGEPIWPGNRKIVIPARQINSGVFVEASR